MAGISTQPSMWVQFVNLGDKVILEGIVWNLETEANFGFCKWRIRRNICLFVSSNVNLIFYHSLPVNKDNFQFYIGRIQGIKLLVICWCLHWYHFKMQFSFLSVETFLRIIFGILLFTFQIISNVYITCLFSRSSRNVSPSLYYNLLKCCLFCSCWWKVFFTSAEKAIPIMWKVSTNKLFPLGKPACSSTSLHVACYIFFIFVKFYLGTCSWKNKLSFQMMKFCSLLIYKSFIQIKFYNIPPRHISINFYLDFKYLYLISTLSYSDTTMFTLSFRGFSSILFFDLTFFWFPLHTFRTSWQHLYDEAGWLAVMIFTVPCIAVGICCFACCCMEPFDEAEFWEEYIAAHERAAAEKARLEALGEEGVGEWMAEPMCWPTFDVDALWLQCMGLL